MSLRVQAGAECGNRAEEVWVTVLDEVASQSRVQMSRRPGSVEIGLFWVCRLQSRNEWNREGWKQEKEQKTGRRRENVQMESSVTGGVDVLLIVVLLIVVLQGQFNMGSRWEEVGVC